MIVTRELTLLTEGEGQIIEIDGEVKRHVAESGVNSGIVTVFVSGTTAGVTVMEHEPGLVADLHTLMERLAPREETYQHNILNQDDNGHSHTRATVIGPSIVVPFASSTPLLGTWQRIVVVDFDSRPRTRQVIMQVMGE